ncbi:hypothetical protein T265_03824 [Opisthorchis viverrini]|uniref:Uncharacterized protein n=1 Tax=Opisthorchis viverrini TaxID=6198 RepID=A0A074ZR95_OPIVI|nr:hypothetical protein T265_03824 [Opisthorchis viverrini]KER29626.1 hypothetical protein T265_03824 [Opisthorchis viverrini]
MRVREQGIQVLKRPPNRSRKVMPPTPTTPYDVKCSVPTEKITKIIDQEDIKAARNEHPVCVHTLLSHYANHLATSRRLELPCQLRAL